MIPLTIAAAVGAHAITVIKKPAKTAVNNIANASVSAEHAFESAERLFGTAGRILDNEGVKMLRQFTYAAESINELISGIIAQGNHMQPQINALLIRLNNIANKIETDINLTSEKALQLLQEGILTCSELRTLMPRLATQITAYLDKAFNQYDLILNETSADFKQIKSALQSVTSKTSIFIERLDINAERIFVALERVTNKINKNSDRIIEVLEYITNKLSANSLQLEKILEKGDNLALMFKYGLIGATILSLLVSSHHIVEKIAAGDKVITNELLTKLQVSSFLGFFIAIAMVVFCPRLIDKWETKQKKEIIKETVAPKTLFFTKFCKEMGVLNEGDNNPYTMPSSKLKRL